MRKECYFSGEVKWAKVQEPTFKYESKEDREYSVTLYLDKDSLATFKGSGLQLKLKDDEDGKHVQFRRSEKKADGELNNPLKVLLNGKEFKDLVGNGSTVSCKVAVYDTSVGVGHRLDAINVTNLVPFEKPEVMGTPF